MTRGGVSGRRSADRTGGWRAAIASFVRASSLRDGELHVDADVLRDEPSLPLQVAAAAAEHDVAIARDALGVARRPRRTLPDPWPAAARAALVDLLLTGHRAVPGHRSARPSGRVGARPSRVVERPLPSRNATRITASRSTGISSRPRRTPANGRAASIVPISWCIGALLHDIGKGYPGDHTEAGVEVVPRHRSAAWGSTRTTSTRSCASSRIISCSRTSPLVEISTIPARSIASPP